MDVQDEINMDVQDIQDKFSGAFDTSMAVTLFQGFCSGSCSLQDKNNMGASNF